MSLSRRQLLASATAVAGSAILRPDWSIKKAHATTAPTTIPIQRMSRAWPGHPWQFGILGDSITAFFWYQYLAKQLADAQIAATPEAIGNFPFTALAHATGPHEWHNAGIGGNDCTNFLADTLAARLAGLKLDVLFIQCGVNCQQHSGPPLGAGTTGILTVDSVCTTNHPLIIAQAQALFPTAQIVWVGGWLHNEQWPDGTNGWDTGPNSMDAKNSITIAACAAASPPILYVDMRTPTFALLPTTNPSNLPTGIYTAISDGIHPSVAPVGAAISGQQLWANIIYPYFRIN